MFWINESDLSSLGFGSSIKPGTHHHHNLEFIKTDGPIPIRIDPTDHLPALRQRAFLPQALKHVLQLLRRDRPILIDIKHLERILEILQHLVVIDVFGVELHKLLEIDEPIAVGIHLLDHDPKLVVRRRVAEAAHDGPQFGGGDLAVAIDVEFLEDLLELLLDLGA